MEQLDTLRVVVVNTTILGMSMEFWSLIVSVLAAIGLWVYVLVTARIAKATELNTIILTRPVVLIGLDDRSEFDHVAVKVWNPSANPAYAKIKIVYTEIRVAKDHKVRLDYPILDGPYGGNEKWSIHAHYEFNGHLKLPKLKEIIDRASVEARLEISAKVSPVSPDGKDCYRDNPTMRYRWKEDEEKWIPNPIQKDT